MKSKSQHLIKEDPQVYAAADPEGIFTAMLSDYPAMLTREEAACILRRDPKTISAMVKSGIIPDVPLPSDGSRMRIIIPKLSILKFLVGAQNCSSEKEASNG